MGVHPTSKPARELELRALKVLQTIKTLRATKRLRTLKRLNEAAKMEPGKWTEKQLLERYLSTQSQIMEGNAVIARL